jgi:hypothetical protein
MLRMFASYCWTCIWFLCIQYFSVLSRTCICISILMKLYFWWKILISGVYLVWRRYLICVVDVSSRPWTRVRAILLCFIETFQFFKKFFTVDWFSIYVRCFSSLCFSALIKLLRKSSSYFSWHRTFFLRTITAHSSLLARFPPPRSPLLQVVNRFS